MTHKTRAPKLNTHFPAEQELEQIQTFQKPLCLSIYVPFTSPNTPDNPLRIEVKNLLREARTALQSAGASNKRIRKTLEPIMSHMEQVEVWPTRHKGLAFFAHPDFFRYYHIPGHTTPRLVRVKTGFDIEPLVQVVQNNQQYYVLTLGHKNVRLYEGDRYQLKPVKFKDFPSNINKALGIDEYPQSRETHSIAPASLGKGSEAYHQQYDVSQTDKAMLLAFFRHIDRRLYKFLQRHQKPLIIAGVSYLLPIYRKVNTYPGLLTRAIIGNQQHTDAQTITEKAWNLVREAE